MTIDASLEIRKLPISHVNKLSSILDVGGQWKTLMRIVPNILAKDNFDCYINCQNPAKYNAEHVRLIEEASQKYARRSTEILLDEWGCSGRIRPAVGHLLHLLVQAELFRAADYVAENILGINRPQRPSQGLEITIPVNVNMEVVLNQMSFSSVNRNLDLSTQSKNVLHIPKIIVTPESETISTVPSFHVENVASNESSSIEFGSSIMASDSSNGTVKSESNNNAMNETNSENTQQSGKSNTDSEILVDEEIRPNISALLNSVESEENDSQTEGSRENYLPNLSILNESSEDQIPILSLLNDVSISNDGISNNSELSLQSMNMPSINKLLSVSEENVINVSNSTDSCDIPNISVLMSTSKIDMENNDSEEDLSLLKLNASVAESNRRSSLNVNSLISNSSKSRQLTSPLPNLSLNTNIPHFTYHEIEAATNNFNEEPYHGQEDQGRFLGAGAFGKVFLAHNLMEKPVAAKKLILENTEIVSVNDRVTKQFTNEVEVCSKFKHKHLLSLLGYSCDGCTYCLLYEYISGGTLKDRLQVAHNKLTWKERLVIAYETAEAITYLHTAFSSPLIHRDIKTANILLDCSNKPKLGDFGITIFLDNYNTLTGTVIGTSAYMAPEALSGGDISIKTDTFSFGVVLLELLTSLPPIDRTRDGYDLVAHVDGLCEDSIQPLLDTSIGTWIENDTNFGEELYVIAKQCLEKMKKRPVMAEVTKMLEKLTNKF